MDIRVSEAMSKDMGTRLTDSIIEALAGSGKFNVVTRTQRNMILKKKGFKQSECASEGCAAEVGRIIGVKKMIAGKVSKVADMYIIKLKLFDVETAQEEKTSDRTVRGSQAELINWAKVLAGDLLVN